MDKTLSCVAAQFPNNWMKSWLTRDRHSSPAVCRRPSLILQCHLKVRQLISIPFSLLLNETGTRCYRFSDDVNTVFTINPTAEVFVPPWVQSNWRKCSDDSVSHAESDKDWLGTCVTCTGWHYLQDYHWFKPTSTWILYRRELHWRWKTRWWFCAGITEGICRHFFEMLLINVWHIEYWTGEQEVHKATIDISRSILCRSIDLCCMYKLVPLITRKHVFTEIN